MKQNYIIKYFIFIALTMASLTKVQAQEFEEVSYDELVQRLSKKKSQIINNQQGSSVLDDILIHAGFALLSSEVAYKMGNQERTSNITGFQFSFGIDLFTPQWSALTYIRNLGGLSSNYASQEIKSNREFDILVFYKNFGTSDLPGYHFGGGFGQRILSASDATSQIEESTPLIILISGLDYHFNRNFSFGAELGYRSNLIPEGKDHSSFDLSIKLDTYF